MYDVIVVGGGHAGCEAALIAEKMGCNVLLISGNLNKLANLPCNPSIGGPAKGILVREIDALGGVMPYISDKTHIQIKLLNQSKGPAVQSLRAQVDKEEYPKQMRKYIETTSVTLLEDFVDQLLIDNNKVVGVKTENQEEIKSKTVILTTGTYLDSKIMVGSKSVFSGPEDEKTTHGISKQLRNLDFDVVRLKTGTPPRVLVDSINYSDLEIHSGDNELRYFKMFPETKYNVDEQYDCYLTYTNEETHRIINDNLHLSSMYGGIKEIGSVGPRYCPSIEDKIVRFNDKERHQIFLEPEGKALNTIYVQGFSSSMPVDVQEKMIRSIKGLENCKIIKYAYAIEYDAINPLELNRTFESKKIDSLYFAGQINGTSGYEEAAAQGLYAGINAVNKITKKDPFYLDRDEAYLGVLVDDLVTKGTKEPYRMLTSRAEFRLLLRSDNANLRLFEKARLNNLLNKSEEKNTQTIIEEVGQFIEFAKNNSIKLTDEINSVIVSLGYEPIVNTRRIYELLKRPEISIDLISPLLDLDYSLLSLKQAEIEIKYEGYILKSRRSASKMKAMEHIKIPAQLDYNDVGNLALEAREKLTKVKPTTLGQASRISGINPADISVLHIYIEKVR